MELAYRFVLYILIANVGYMIFSLYRRGFKHYSGYISQLFFLLCLMIVLVFREVSGGLALGVSLTGITVIVLLPIFLQRQIDALMAENRISEIEPYARWKANLAWSELNVHMHEIARLAEEFGDDSLRIETEIRALLRRGEPYDSMTRIFLGLIHFNNRNFDGLIRDLHDDDRNINDHSFEELLYLVRAYLETTRYEEAVMAQMALEAKINDGEDLSPEKRANLVISRMIFLAFLGWLPDFDLLMQAGEEGLERLPGPLCSFWRGVCLFNSGNYDAGEKAMSEVMKSFGEDAEDAEEAMLPFMRKRFFALVENRDFFDRKVLPHLQSLHVKYGLKLSEIVCIESIAAERAELSQTVSSILGWLTMIISAIIMMVYDVEDVVDLVEIGANSAFLVQNGEYFRLFTYQFIHIGWLHLVMNIVALKFFGPPVETIAGWPIFLGVYFISGIVGGAAAVYNGQPLSAGASAAVLGLLAAAIVFEICKVKGSDRLPKRNNISTLVFILIINLIIGAVEKVVDNSAHLGGLAAGAVLGLLLVPILNSQLMKRVVGFVSVWLCFFLCLFSLYQMFTLAPEGFYPQRILPYKNYHNPANGMKFDIPGSWNIEADSETINGVEIVGPFRERLTVLIAGNEEPHEKVVNEYVNQRTREIEGTSEVLLKSRKGPERIENQLKTEYCIRWQLDAQGGPLTVVDYLIFEKKQLYLFRFFLGTGKDKAYDQIMNHSVKTFYLE